MNKTNQVCRFYLLVCLFFCFVHRLDLVRLGFVGLSISLIVWLSGCLCGLMRVFCLSALFDLCCVVSCFGRLCLCLLGYLGLCLVWLLV